MDNSFTLLGNIKGPKGDKGDKGDVGAGLKVLGYYATVEELSATITNPSAGDAYGIGSEHPYDIYIYSENQGWVNNGQLQGAKGDKGDKGDRGEKGDKGEKGDTGGQPIVIDLTNNENPTTIDDVLFSDTLKNLIAGGVYHIHYGTNIETLNAVLTVQQQFYASESCNERIVQQIEFYLGNLIPQKLLYRYLHYNGVTGNIYAEGDWVDIHDVDTIVKDGSFGMRKLDSSVKSILERVGTVEHYFLEPDKNEYINVDNADEKYIITFDTDPVRYSAISLELLDQNLVSPKVTTTNDGLTTTIVVAEQDVDFTSIVLVSDVYNIATVTTIKNPTSIKDGSIGMSKLDDEVKSILSGGVNVIGDDGDVVIPEEITSHITDTVKHITDAERDNLNSAIEHTFDSTVHITDAERTNWNSKAPSGHGLGVGTNGVDNKSFLKTLQMGGGFYQVANADDTPTTGDPSWINLIQSVRGTADGSETGVQLAFYDWTPNNPHMWLRNVFKGTAGNWVEMIHTGNIGNYISSDSPKFVSGSYTGTGTYVDGQETPTNIAAGQSSIQFPAYPRLVMIRQKGCHFWNTIIPDAYNDFEFYTYGGNDYSGGMCTGKVTADFKLNWYAHKQNWYYSADLTTGNVSLKLRTDNVTTDNIATLKPFYQLNNEGSTYEYFAICY